MPKIKYIIVAAVIIICVIVIITSLDSNIIESSNFQVSKSNKQNSEDIWQMAKR